jgi:hypothetical protein
MRHMLVLCLLLAFGGSSLAAERAGVSAGVRGEVALARASDAQRPLRSGEEILMRDALSSGPRSGMQILLLDETVFTMGPQSELIVDEFVYDPATKRGRVNASVTKGVFRFVTGWIPKQDPKDMEVKLPSGTLGVRGTIVGGDVNPATKSSLLVLLGEGRENDTGSPAGAFEACNAGVCRMVRRAGFGVTIGGPDSPPSEPFRIPVEDVRRITGAVSDPGGAIDVAAGLGGQGDAGDGMGPRDPRQPTDVAGEGGAAGDAERARNRMDRVGVLDALTDAATQDARRIEDVDPDDPGSGFAGGIAAPFPPGLSLPDDVTRYDDLLTGGALGGTTAVYSREVRSADGGYDFLLRVDAGSRTADLSFTNIRSEAFGISGANLVGLDRPFGAPSEFVVFAAEGSLDSSRYGALPAVGVAILLDQPSPAGSALQLLGVGRALVDEPEGRPGIAPFFTVLTPDDQRIVPRSPADE